MGQLEQWREDLECNGGQCTLEFLAEHVDFTRIGSKWSDDQKSKVVENALLRIPNGIIHIHQGEDGYYLLSGHDCAKALVDFYGGKFKLCSLEFLTEFDGMGFNDLDSELQDGIRALSIQLICFSNHLNDYDLNKLLKSNLNPQWVDSDNSFMKKQIRWKSIPQGDFHEIAFYYNGYNIENARVAKMVYERICELVNRGDEISDKIVATFADHGRELEVAELFGKHLEERWRIAKSIEELITLEYNSGNWYLNRINYDLHDVVDELSDEEQLRVTVKHHIENELDKSIFKIKNGYFIQFVG